jgi:hypothetical protein
MPLAVLEPAYGDEVVLAIAAALPATGNRAGLLWHDGLCRRLLALRLLLLPVELFLEFLFWGTVFGALSCDSVDIFRCTDQGV